MRKTLTAGFSLVELIVAMAVFLVVSISSFSLYSRHEALLSKEQGTAGLNIGLRNALSMLQMDMANAGNGQIQGPNVPAWPIGVTIINSNPTAATCDPTNFNPPQYQDACFDQLNVVMVDSTTPPIQPTNTCATPFDTSVANPMISGTVANPPAGPNLTAAQVAAKYSTGDEILFVKGTVNGATSVYPFTTALLTANGASVGTNVNLRFSPTLSTGQDSPGVGGHPPANDPLSMTINAPLTDLTNLYCSTDWILRMVPISYKVITTNIINGVQDPQLVRTQGQTTNVVMDQVIGFKVGAAFWNSGQSTFAYCYSSGAYCDNSDTTPGYNNDFTLIRSVRVTLIGRTAPSTDPLYTYRNPFDNGPYQIRGSSIVVDPRNLTMNND